MASRQNPRHSHGREEVGRHRKLGVVETPSRWEYLWFALFLAANVAFPVVMALRSKIIEH